ncbi:uncharacterized protein LOC134766562 [Penaeus indicus]|uniref:uncharacterized protein LOC134766562 n=1 Tax=Penaeus indicus TaxID=29960 RepID=UPI00300CA2DA
MKDTAGGCGPLLRFLFQYEDRIQKEIFSIFNQEETDTTKSHVSLSDETRTALRDKLLSHPHETSCILHELVVRNRILRERGGDHENVSEAENKNADGEEKGSSQESSKKKSHCIFGDILKECLDHCLRRVESLDDKLKAMEEDYVSAMSRPKKNFSPKKLSFGTPKNGASDSVEVAKLLERSQATETEKQRNEALLYKILSLSSDAPLSYLCELFPRMLQLCYEKSLLASNKLHFSNLSSSETCLRLFCEMEGEYLSSSSHINKASLVERLPSFTPTDVREMFLSCAAESKHVLQLIFEGLVVDGVKSMKEMEDCDTENWILTLWPMIFLHAWSTSVDKMESLIWISAVWENHPRNIDPLLFDICSDLNRDMDLVRWCLTRSTSVKILPLLQLIRNHSPLFTLHKSLPLHTLWPEEVLHLLDEHSKARDPSGTLSSSCQSTYKAFCILLSVFQVIGSGMQLDNAVAGRQARGKLHGDKGQIFGRNMDTSSEGISNYRDRQAPLQFYQQNILEKLQEVRRMIDELKPLECRVEVMENIFSLLFVRHSDMSDEGQSESGGEEGELERSFLSQQTDVESLASTSHAFIDLHLNPAASAGDKEKEQSTKKVKKVLDFADQVVLEESSSETVNLSVRELSPFGSASEEEKTSGSSTEANSKDLKTTESSEASKIHGSSWPPASSERLTWDTHQQSPQSGPTCHHQSSCTVSGKSTGSSMGELPHTGYLINSLVAWDILLLLRDSILTASAQTYTEIGQQAETKESCSRKEVQVRLSSLSRLISEGLWRMQVIAPYNRKFGSVENFDDFLDGTLISGNTGYTVYENSMQTSAKSKVPHSGQTSNSQGMKKRHGKEHELTESTTGLQEHTSVITYLLAPPSSLITLALANGNVTRAEQVVKMYKVVDSTEKREVCLTNRLSQLRPKLSLTSQKSGKLKESKGVQHKGYSKDLIQNIGLLAREGSAQVSTTNLIHDLVTSTPPPIPQCLSTKVIEGSCQIASSFLSPQALVLADLALTVDLTETTASYLMEQALQRSVSQPSVPSSLPKTIGNIQGYIPVLQKLASMCSTLIAVRTLESESDSDGANKNPSVDSSAYVCPFSATPMSLMLSPLPLGESELKNYVKAWSKFLDCFAATQDTLLWFDDSDNVDSSINIHIHSGKNRAHMSYKLLLQILSEKANHLYRSSIKECQEAKMGAFVRTFYQYLQLMSAMVTLHADEKYHNNMKSYFSLLKQRPVHILGSLMFQEGVDPVKLEPIAARMRLNLTAMILQYCCPKITVSYEFLHRRGHDTEVQDAASRLGFQASQGQVIMNSRIIEGTSAVYGEVVVRDILTSLLSGLKEAIQPQALTFTHCHKAVILNDATAPNALLLTDIQEALNDTSELAAMDFTKIPPNEEAVVFFINLANLMYIHAGLLNHILYPKSKLGESRGIFSSYLIERLMAMKHLGYNLGQLGFLSLYDVLFGVLQLQNPLSSLLIQNEENVRVSLCESSVIKSSLQHDNAEKWKHISGLITAFPSKLSFCITQGNPVSPLVQVIYADRLEEHIEAAVSEHLNMFSLVKESHSGNADGEIDHPHGTQKVNLCVSRTILNYVARHCNGTFDEILSLMQEVNEEVASFFTKSDGGISSKKQVEISVLDNNEDQGIAVDYVEHLVNQEFAMTHNISESIVSPAASDGLDWTSVKVPPTVLSHLRRQCPLLAFIVQALHSALEMKRQKGHSWADDEADAWHKILYPPERGVKPQQEETHHFRACRNVFTNSRYKALGRISQDSNVLSALLIDPDISSIWSLADQLLGSQTITKDCTTERQSNVNSLMTVLQALPTATMEAHPNLQSLLDQLLVFMVQTSDVSADPKPWMYAYHISDCNVRYTAVQEAHKSWPASAAVDHLNIMVYDSRLPRPKQEWAQNKAVQIRVYEEILRVGNPEVSSWQEIEKMSEEEPAVLLQMLLQKKQFKLGVQWAEHHNVSPELRRLVDQSYLMSVLDKTNPEYGTALEALHALSSNDLVIVIQALLDRLSSPPTRRFLIEFLLKTQFTSEAVTLCKGNNELPGKEDEEGITPSTVPPSIALPNLSDLQQEVMGLILVEDIAPHADDRFQLSHLASTPHLIIEQWLMNIKLEAVEKAIKTLSQHLDLVDSRMSSSIHSQDFGISSLCKEAGVQKREPQSLSWDVLNWLLEAYAAKALDTTGVQVTLKPQTLNENVPKKFVMPARPPERHEWIPDAEVRECPICRVAVFSMFCRRHHCRRCGRVVCGSCSKARIVVQGYGDLQVRVCIECYQQTKNLNLEDYIQVRPLGDGTYDTVSQSSEGLVSARGGGGSSCTSDTEGGWYLSTDPDHNALVRQEFCYDYAPSLSLCLAILAQHQDHKRAAVCIVKLCHHLFSLIVSSIKSASPEVDNTFVLSMIQTLLASSKVRFGNIGEHQGIALCEYYTQWVDLIALLSKANCGYIIPIPSLQNMLQIGELHRKNLMGEEKLKEKLERCLQQEFVHMRHLRDMLVKKQLWELALNISTKAGLEATGVWGAWAMASLKAGDFPGARERFSRVLERPFDKRRPCRSSLLPEVIKYLESNPFSVDQKVMEQAERARATIMMNDQSRLPPSQALVVLHSLQELNGISNGLLTNRESNKQIFSSHRTKKKNNSKMDSLFQTECKYYLCLYGNHCMTIQYFMRNKQMQECVNYLLSEEIEVDLFVHEVLVPILRCGQLDMLLRNFRAIDPKQEKWAKYMLGGCRWLERQGWWNSLLAVQEALGDRLRAAMTLLRMYSHAVDSYNGLANRVHHLLAAKSHLQAYLDTQALHQSSAKKKKIILNMSGWQVNQHINTLTLQADVTKFLANCEAKGNVLCSLLHNLHKLKVLGNISLPTLLGDEEERLAVASLAICGAQSVADGLSLAYRVVEGSGISAEKLLSVVSQLLVAHEQYSTVGQVVRGMQEWGVLKAKTIDIALQPALLATASSTQNTHLDALVKLLSSDSAKIEAYIKCGRLKSAYLVAVHRGRHEDVVKVQEVAKSNGQAHVATMCSKWLANYENRVSARM